MLQFIFGCDVTLMIHLFNTIVLLSTTIQWRVSECLECPSCDCVIEFIIRDQETRETSDNERSKGLIVGALFSILFYPLNRVYTEGETDFPRSFVSVALSFDTRIVVVTPKNLVPSKQPTKSRSPWVLLASFLFSVWSVVQWSGSQ